MKKKSMTRRMLIMIGALLVLVAVIAFAFYLHVQKLIASAPKPGPQTVSTIEAEQLQWQPQLSSVGTVVAVRGVDVTTEIAGLVRTVSFRSGQDVKAGTVLVQLIADTDIAQLRSLEAAAELSASTLKRDQAQLKAEAISQAQIDNDLADLKSRRALAAQQAALIAKKTIRAPFAGRLGISTLQPGQYLNPGDRIVTLQTIDPVFVDFSLPQKQVGDVSVRQIVNIAVDAFPGRNFPGKINAISPKVDPTSRNVSLEATIPNPTDELLPGMFVRVSVDVGQPVSFLTLPLTAITYNPYGSTVFLVVPAGSLSPGDAASSPGAGASAQAAAAPASPASPASGASGLVAQQVFVTTGETRGDQVAIVKGIAPGQKVVTSGQLKLKNGTPVVIDNSVQPANNPAPRPQEK